MKWLLIAVTAVLVMPAAYRVFGPEASPPWSAVVETKVRFAVPDGDGRGVVFATRGPADVARPAVVIARGGDDADTVRLDAGLLARRGSIVLVVDESSPDVAAGALAYLRSRADVDPRRIRYGREATAE
ncbi:hypothetical protein HN371_09320 [Candidatus Poribacteria bacterium]|jgi:hypothetical protein|nr:hypothetical protein [Candidatus Poribacteria bacterium]MBT5535279.1 hypothetical protein [Candidatus Poribacteria bacterium]MBT5710346.1 hypothetical protein [Candidatus Poribacteria bacterium]MBT7098648.1 hypothetical protein [Candidatus Poribacteria bacterium]MBT7804749.1 hypothetical protein [Candidatus Poribacteria bacterium]